MSLRKNQAECGRGGAGGKEGPLESSESIRQLCQRSAGSARFLGKDEDLTGVNAVRISDLVMVRTVNDCVSFSRTIDRTADAPQAVATRYHRGCNLGHRHRGGGAGVRRRCGGNVLRLRNSKRVLRGLGRLKR